MEAIRTGIDTELSRGTNVRANQERKKNMDKPGHLDGGSKLVGQRVRDRLEIEAIAHELDRPIEEVAALFAALDFEMRSRARVTDFLPVLVARHVRARYRLLQ